MKRFMRAEILDALATTISRRVPVLAAGSSCGLVAKCAAQAGADLIVVYSTGRSRLMGLPTSRIGDSNASTLEMAEEITNVVTSVPVIGGIEAWDPTRLDLERLLDLFEAAGFSGVINYPTISTMGRLWRDRRERVGLGFTREVELIELARGRNLFTLSYVATPEDAERMAQAGVDCLVPHVGATAGGLVGHETNETRESQIDELERMISAASGVRDDLIFLAHGGTLAEPADLDAVYARTRCVGFVGASSIERIPIERAVMDVVTQFKAAPPRWAQETEPPWVPTRSAAGGGDWT
ncbi:phosphoenolpyruvate hydrolase family protein [Kribbella sp. NPDC050124]|uniref:phosphoenolpyruvate hydrolase family protein n=1 Tax=Kribbella sp. NPDC050124 TaxID=3364114 RepID=UPI00378C6CCD